MKHASSLWLVIIGLAWPVIFALAAVCWPGSARPDYTPPGQQVYVAPEPARGMIFMGPADGRATAFWESPEPGRVKIVIEVDPQDDATP